MTILPQDGVEITPAISDHTPPSRFKPAHVLPGGDGTFYLAIPTEYQTPSECDACGKRRSQGYALYYLSDMTACDITGAWSCTLDCAANNAMADYAAGSAEGGAA